MHNQSFDTAKINEILSYNDQALAFLGAGNCSFVQHRQEFLKPEIVFDLFHLCAQKTSCTDQFFDNIAETIKNKKEERGIQREM